MPRIVRDAEVTWKGTVARGAGEITAASSGAFTALPYSLPSRIGSPEGRTSPEELLAAAHGGCFAMSLSSELSSAELPPDEVHVRCTIVMDEVEGKGHQIVGSLLAVSATGSGIGETELATAIAAADEGCPFSTLLREAGATIEITTTGGMS
jgi:osmotically inducible protein OsmC